MFLLLSHPRACGTLNDAQFAPQGMRTESPACCAPDAGFPIGGAQSGSLHAHAAGRDGTREWLDVFRPTTLPMWRRPNGGLRFIPPCIPPGRRLQL
jgi:hypothetical protein